MEAMAGSCLVTSAFLDEMLNNALWIIFQFQDYAWDKLLMRYQAIKSQLWSSNSSQFQQSKAER